MSKRKLDLVQVVCALLIGGMTAAAIGFLISAGLSTMEVYCG